MKNNPDKQRQYIEQASTLISSRRYAEAIKLLRDVLRNGCRTGQVHFLLGVAHQSLQEIDNAFTHYKRASELEPNNFDAAVGIANIHLLRREYDQANTILNPMMDLAEPPVSAVLVYAQLASTINHQQRAIEKLKKAVSNTSYTQRSKVYFALGKLSDEQQDYDTAFNYYHQGNQLVNAVYKKEEFEAYFDSIINTFDSDFIRTRRRSGGERLIFIVGMPRSGSSLTEQIIASHPDVFGAGELQALPSIARWLGPYPNSSLSSEMVEAGATQYLNYIDSLDKHSACITDKMPDNFLYLGLINIFFPEAKIIHCIRHAYDTCLSCYFQQFSGNYPYAYNLENLGHYYGSYQKLMNHWKHVLPIYNINYEDLVLNQQDETRKVLEYCGLAWDDQCLTFHKSDRAISTASSQQASKPLYTTSVNRFIKYEKHLDPLVHQLPLE